MKLITFAVPCYNSAEYMNKCINSLLPAGKNAEIIIINDGSTKDNTADIADRYAKEYPDIIKAIHQENGGHGEAVNTGLKNASGKYFKVVDSDDWLEESALQKVMQTISSFEEDCPDAILCNYVYEHVYNNTRKIVDYRKSFPKEKSFTFEQSKTLPAGKFIAMHSLIYKTSLLKEINLELPKHTFYVDNLYIYKPLPYVKSFYYLDVDLYRYLIGRPDQSVNEDVIMRRIDQHIKVTEIILSTHDVLTIKKDRPKLYKYMESYLLIMMVINSIYLIKQSTKESLKKKKELWAKLKVQSPKLYKRFRHRFTGCLVGSNSRFVCGVCKIGYVIVRKIFKFN